MKKYLFFSLLIIIGLLVSSNWSLAQAIFKTQLIQTLPVLELSQTGEAEAGVSMPLPTDTSKIPSAGEVPMLQIEIHSFAGVAEKCGVNTFRIENECGIGVFKDVYFQCYDGYEEKEGGEGSCKSAEVWQKYAEKVCLNRCGTITGPPPAAGPALEIIKKEATETAPISVCYISEKLTRDYNQLMLQYNEIEATGDKMQIKDIENKIYDLKMQIEKSREECRTVTRQPEADRPPTEERPHVIEPVDIDRCAEVNHMQKKLDYYMNLRNLTDTEVTEQTGFPKGELGVEDIIRELTESIEKVKEQCSIQGGIVRQKTITTREQIPVKVFEPVNPVVVESGEEIDVYYRAKIEKLTSVEAIDEQIHYLKTLRKEIDILIERLIKSRKEIEVKELSNVVTEIKLSKGEIKADDVVIKTTAKKMLMNIGEKPISIEPTEKDVLIKDGGLEIKVKEISIKENIMRVGAAEVRMAASAVVEKLQISPKAVELKEENAKAVYKMKVDEPRKLFGFIPLTIQKTMTTDADNGDVLKEQRPWYAFFTTK